MQVSLNKEKIKLILARKNKTQSWLANNIGTTKQYLWQMLNGKRHPSADMRNRILFALRRAKWDEIFIIKENQS